MQSSETPTPEEVRAALAPLDPREQKIVGGMLTVMMTEPDRVREREWIAEQLTRVTLLAGEFEGDSPDAGVQAVQDYLRDKAPGLLSASFLLFQRVGLDMAPRAEAGFSFEEALACGLQYLPLPASEGEEVARPAERNLGEQPIARLMIERDLKPRDLVAASSEQLTHKMVARAMKGRRLTANTMGKVHRAWIQAAGTEDALGDLFDYEP